VANLQDREPILIPADDGYHYSNVVIDAGIAALTRTTDEPFSCAVGVCQDVLILDVATGEITPIATTSQDEAAYALSWPWLIYGTWDGTSTRLVARDLSTLAEPLTLRVVPDYNHYGSTLWGVAFDGMRVAWVEPDDTDLVPKGPSHDNFFTQRIGETEPTLISTNRSVEHTAVVGNQVVDVSGPNNEVLIHDSVTGATHMISDRGGPLAATDRYVFWRYESEPWDLREEVWVYDLFAASVFVAPIGRFDSFHAHNGTFIWSRFIVDTLYEVHANTIADLLPSAPRPDPGPTESYQRYFPETGHYLSWGFRGYWDGNGGLPVFGYPLTEEYLERNADTGELYTVQYLERQRFEWYPENAGSPYAVLLGRLGAEDAAARGLLDDPAFQPADPNTPTAGCRYVEATGHNLCGVFWQYWLTHGLEMGDIGISEREALALFGYPLSEAFIDPETGLLMQYFERAVFEFHPDNAGTDYQVLLRRLGAEVVAARGWQ
jgi:hypothetical protein